jgi:tRNA uridine 5-carboxymethylaminomethyl modification enzyme
LADLISRPELNYEKITAIETLGPTVANPLVREQIDIQLKYAGYISRQQDEIDKHRRHEKTQIPTDLNYAQVKSLSTEVREKLSQHRPHTIGQASRIPGVTPAAISILLVHLKKMTPVHEI